MLRDAKQIVRLKQEIVARWKRLPPEHQATLLLVLMDDSAWAEWSAWNWLALQPDGGKSP